MFILFFEDTRCGENNATVWDSERAARQQAVSEILDDVRDWDMDDPDIEKYAKDINDYASSGDLEGAMDAYNEYNGESYGGGLFYSVSERVLLSLADAAPVTPLLFDDESEEEEEDDEDGDDAPFVATTPGATCRGPCGNYNPDAYADRSDGTHLCYQCKTFSSIFGG